MRNSFLKHYPYALVVIILVIVAAGCAGKVNQPVPATVTAASPSPVVPKPATATASPEPVLPQTAATTAPQPTADSHLRYQSNFSDPNSGWPQQKFDNYFIGYHPPSFYHIDIHSANDKRIVPTPDKSSYGDATIETKIYTEPNNTDPNGDFRYGTAFRRSGDQYYAFTISPRTKHWYMLKVSPNEVAVLKEGTEDSIQGLQGEDTLRVDAQGSTFFLRINDHLVGQVSDPDYAKGEVGLYAETFDSPHIHIHFESITVRDVEAPQLKCDVIATALRVRSGPSTSFDPPILFLPSGASLEAQGRSADGNWIQVKVASSGQAGWVYDSEGILSCNFSVADLPVVSP